MTRTFCDVCGQHIADGKQRAEMAVSWSVPIHTTRREHEYEICLTCAETLRAYLDGEPKALPNPMPFATPPKKKRTAR